MQPPIFHTPTGAAGEYAELALRGPYVGCTGACAYCYNPKLHRKTMAQWVKARPMKNFLKRLEREAPALMGDLRRVFMSFGCDPCQPCEEVHGLTAEALERLAFYRLSPHLLTKFGRRAARHFDALQRDPRARFWQTLTSLDPAQAALWEAGAAPPAERAAVQREAYERGIDTGLSLEPTIYPTATLEVIETLGPITAHISLGKLNHMTLGQVRAVDPAAQPVNWRAFLGQARRIFAAQGRLELRDPHQEVEPGMRTYYVKRDLWRAA